jgi:predicted secreted protein
LSAISQETTPEVVTSAASTPKKMNAAVVTTMTTAFLKRLGHKSGLKPKRVSLEGDVYTFEVDTKRFTAVVRIGAETREIKEYDVQPKSEESSFFSLSPKFILTVLIISAAVNVGLYFGLKVLGL